MKNKSKLRRIFTPGMRLYFIMLIIFAVATFFCGGFEKQLAYVEAGVLVVLLVYSRITSIRRSRALMGYMENMGYNVDSAVKDTLKNFPMPMVIFSMDDMSIISANEEFRKMTGEKEHLFERCLSDEIPDFRPKWLLEGKNEAPEQVKVGEKTYRVFGSLVRNVKGQSTGEYIATTYWMDVTEAAKIADDFVKTRPVFAIIMFDNYDEFFTGMSEKEKSAALSDIDDRISDWAGKCGGYFAKFDRDRYIFVFEEQYLQHFIDGRFSLLDAVREIRNPLGQRATISIGIGRDGKSMEESARFATLSIEMALSRGGDQAVIKNRFSFDFYGGRSAELEKRTKVKSRVMAGSLTELMRDSSNIFVMGHRYSDLDCIGAAAGVVCAARKMKKTAHIVVDMENNVSSNLIERLRQSPFYAETFVDSQKAILEANINTLLVVVDTNRPNQTESDELLASCTRVAVIDHHRRAAEYIEHAALSVHEPYASSASELVAELLQYMLDPTDITRPEAEALMAGIVLDTKNFTLRTGGRTFEAAAFLRRAGADPTEVKKLLQSDISTAMSRYGLIQQAKIYRTGIAIASAATGHTRIVAAQAADELLNISGIQASFVIYPETDSVCISARSIGDINVQVILEKLGGGGNKSTAGAQIRGKNQAQVIRELTAAIDSFIEENDLKI